MAHVVVNCTYELAGCEALHRDSLAPELNARIAAVSGARADTCRARFVRAEDEWYIGGGTEETHQAVHIEIALEAGRKPEVRRTLSESVIVLLRSHLVPAPQFEVHLSVEARDLDPYGYASHVEPAHSGPRDAVEEDG